MDLNTQLKNNLISRIKDSDDINFLKALQTIFDSSEHSLYKLTKEQENSIEEGRKEIRNGESKSNESVNSEMEEWLKRK